MDLSQKFGKPRLGNPVHAARDAVKKTLLAALHTNPEGLRDRVKSYALASHGSVASVVDAFITSSIDEGNGDDKNFLVEEINKLDVQGFSEYVDHSHKALIQRIKDQIETYGQDHDF
jgi:hypothetical protein